MRPGFEWFWGFVVAAGSRLAAPSYLWVLGFKVLVKHSVGSLQATQGQGRIVFEADWPSYIRPPDESPFPLRVNLMDNGKLRAKHLGTQSRTAKASYFSVILHGLGFVSVSVGFRGKL